MQNTHTHTHVRIKHRTRTRTRTLAWAQPEHVQQSQAANTGRLVVKQHAKGTGTGTQSRDWEHRTGTSRDEMKRLWSEKHNTLGARYLVVGALAQVGQQGARRRPCKHQGKGAGVAVPASTKQGLVHHDGVQLHQGHAARHHDEADGLQGSPSGERGDEGKQALAAAQQHVHTAVGPCLNGLGQGVAVDEHSTSCSESQRRWREGTEGGSGGCTREGRGTWVTNISPSAVHIPRTAGAHTTTT
jgi:hypothetical protein